MNDKSFRKKYRTSSATIDYIIADLTLNKISNKESYFIRCVNDKLQELEEDYNNRVNIMLDFIIYHCNFTNMPVNCISEILRSLSKVTNALSKGLMSVFSDK